MQGIREIPGGWSLVRTVWLRGAGFPIDHLQRLGAPDTLALLQRIEAQRAELLRAKEGAFIELRAHSAKLSKAELKPLRALMKQLGREGVVNAEGLEGRFAQLLRPINARYEALCALVAQARESFEKERLKEAVALLELARSPRFQEALLWQSRGALKGTVAAFLRRAPSDNGSKSREHRRLIARYLQRYTTKNETIGFFGPVGWAQIVDAPSWIEVEPGESLLDKRTVYFERWAIDALAESFSEDDELLEHLPPRLSPSMRLEDDALLDSQGRRFDLPPVFVQALSLCDGRRPAKEIAQRMLQTPEHELEEPEEVYGLLAQLKAQRLLIWRLEVPVWTWAPERALLRALEQVPEEVASKPRALLDEFEQKRSAVGQAAGDVEALDKAIQELEHLFVDTTHQAAQRRAGEAYAGRTLIYEDCVRGVHCTFGDQLVDSLSGALSLIFESARWYTHRIARAYRAVIEQTFESFAQAQVDYLLFWRKIEAKLGSLEAPSDEIVEAREQLQQRWESLLLRPEPGPVEHRSAELKARVEEVFAAPGPGWPQARFHSPDILLAAPDVEAIQAGEGLFVLGEIHASVNSLFSQVAIAQHPDPTPLLNTCMEAVEGSFLIPTESGSFATRADFLPASDRAPQVELGHAPSPLPREQVYAASELVVEQHAGALVIRSRKDGRRFDLLASLGQYLSFLGNSEFSFFAERPRTPRVTIDRLVIQREKWCLDEWPELPKDAFDGLEKLNAWRSSLGIPRRAFLKVPQENKPICVDFGSPTSVDMLCRLLKKAKSAVFSEMLPTPEQVWLPDAQGGKYTSELRIAAIDPKPWRPV